MWKRDYHSTGPYEWSLDPFVQKRLLGAYWVPDTAPAVGNTDLRVPMQEKLENLQDYTSKEHILISMKKNYKSSSCISTIYYKNYF